MTPLLAPLARALRPLRPIREHQLLRHCHAALPPLDHLDPPLRLFRAHFLVRAGLYTLAARWQHRPWGLHIDAFGAERIPKRGANTHNTVGFVDSGLAEFYLDFHNYDLATSASVAQLLMSFWQQYNKVEERGEALAVLGLTDGATPQQIKAAYRRAAHRAHPDRGGHADAFLRATRAYASLK